MTSSYDRILDATLELVREKSYHGASTTVIAEKANISKSTIFYYFKSKEGILLKLFEETALNVRKQAWSILNDESLTGKEKLKKWTFSYLGNLETVGDIIKVYLRESRFISDKSKTFFKNRQRTFVNLIAKIIEQIQNEDEQAFKHSDPKIVARSILGMYNSVTNWFDHEGEISTEELAEMMYEMVCGSFQESKTAHIKLPGRYRLSKQSVPAKNGQPCFSKRVL